MQQILSNLVVYRSLTEDALLKSLAETVSDWQEEKASREALTARIYRDINSLLALALEHGFDENLWHCYLTHLLLNDENPYSLTCECAPAGEGTLSTLAKRDCQALYDLYHFDFKSLEKSLNIDSFSMASRYQAMGSRKGRYSRESGEKLLALSRSLSAAKNGDELFTLLTKQYQNHGVGLFGLHSAFRISDNGGEDLSFQPAQSTEKVRFSDLVGYDLQKQQLRDNTDAFVDGRSANNTLLYGDSGTGKSTSVKALIHEYYPRGLRIIEVYKHQFRLLPQLIAAIKNRNYRFIIFIDDLSFEESEVEYKFLKAVIEGGVETKPDNILIYATSNRRHIVKEMWQDRKDMEYTGEVHRSDTVEEKISLSSRFGVQINYSIPNRKLFHLIVEQLAKGRNLDIPEAELLAEANKWELRHGGLSGRTARQFIDYLDGKKP